MDRKETRVVLAWLRASLAAAAGGAEERVGGADSGGAAREAAAGQARGSSPEEEEDWDRELEIEEAARGRPPQLRKQLSNMFAPALRPSDAASDAPTLAADDGALPERWLLARALDAKSARPVIVMYPKASQLYSLRARDPPPPTPRTKWTRRVPHPVLIGHAASLTPY
jgi:hypothetical protein